MNSPTRWALASLATVLLLANACSKKPEAAPKSAKPAAAASGSAMPTAPDPDPPGALPGTSAVRFALARKEYSGAVERLTALRPLATAADKVPEFRMLSAEVGEALAEAAPTDPAAAQALALYQAQVSGR